MLYTNTMVKKGTKRVGNYPPAKYVYKNGDTKHPWAVRSCPNCGIEKLMQTRKKFCSLSCSQSGDNNSMWAGEKAKYVARHNRVYRSRGMARDQLCSFCDSMALDWAHIHDTDSKDIYNYMPLCRSCHLKYDKSTKQQGGQ